MFGIDFFDPQTLWLNITNLGLGIITLLCVGAVAWGVTQDLVLRWWNAPAAELDDHAFAVPGLGMTMADGGKKLDDEKEEEN